MKNLPKVSVIIPVKKINDYILESVPKVLELDWLELEILIITDKKQRKYKWPKTKFLVSGSVGPAAKRDLAAQAAEGGILAFLDDDAYPQKDWLTKAIRHFANKKVGAVGGPAITPPDSGILPKVSGAIFESYVGGGNARNRYLSLGKAKEVDDWPTVNLLVRKDLFTKIGGFDSHYWPGEDTKLCLDIITNGFKIIYEPQAIVYHHRRADLLRHFKQIGNYGLHRGFFVKKFPQTSLRIWYFLPSLFLIYVISIPFIYPYLNIYVLPVLIYFLLVGIDCLVIIFRWKNILVGLLTAPLTFLTHLYYGLMFIVGLMSRELEQ